MSTDPTIPATALLPAPRTEVFDQDPPEQDLFTTIAALGAQNRISGIRQALTRLDTNHAAHLARIEARRVTEHDEQHAAMLDTFQGLCHTRTVDSPAPVDVTPAREWLVAHGYPDPGCDMVLVDQLVHVTTVNALARYTREWARSERKARFQAQAATAVYTQTRDRLEASLLRAEAHASKAV